MSEFSEINTDKADIIGTGDRGQTDPAALAGQDGGADQTDHDERPETVVIEVGAEYEGEVLRIKPFGAIIGLPGGGQGLLHISHIAATYVREVEDYLSVGDKVMVKVLSREEGTGRLSLSMKEASRRGGERPGDGRRPVNGGSFEDKFKEWLKSSNERQAGINKRNKRR